VSGFNAIRASGAIDIYFSQGPHKVVVSAAKPEDVENIVTELEGNTLVIRFKDKKSWWSDQWNTMGRKYKVYVSAPGIRAITQMGSGNIRIEGTLKSPELSFEVAGSGNIEGVIQTEKLDIEQSGSSNIRLSGMARQASFQCSGSGNIVGGELVTDDCDIEISGSGNADITVNKELRVELSGSGNIRYRGTGNLVSSEVSGSGKIRKI
jgi:hypothetical protein